MLWILDHTGTLLAVRISQLSPMLTPTGSLRRDCVMHILCESGICVGTPPIIDAGIEELYPPFATHSAQELKELM